MRIQAGWSFRKGQVLIAPPGVLTELKQKLSKRMAKIVVNDLQKDLTKVPDHDLTEHILPAR